MAQARVVADARWQRGTLVILLCASYASRASVQASLSLDVDDEYCLRNWKGTLVSSENEQGAVQKIVVRAQVYWSTKRK
jgi:hypothetical protein